MIVLVYISLTIGVASLAFDIVATRWHIKDRKHLHGGGHANHVAEIVADKLSQPILTWPVASHRDMDTFLRERYPVEPGMEVYGAGAESEDVR